MTKFWQTLVLGMIFVAGTTSMAADSIHEFKMKDIEGKEVELSEFKDKVVMPSPLYSGAAALMLGVVLDNPTLITGDGPRLAYIVY